jgi:hypothetical protein
VVVDGQPFMDGYGYGDYVLNVREVPGAETACTDAVDEDADGDLDCLDPDCTADSGCIETCPELVAVGFPTVVNGSTLGRPNQHAGDCDISQRDLTSDQSVAFTAPSDGTYGFALSTDTSYSRNERNRPTIGLQTMRSDAAAVCPPDRGAGTPRPMRSLTFDSSRRPLGHVGTASRRAGGSRLAASSPSHRISTRGTCQLSTRRRDR